MTSVETKLTGIIGTHTLLDPEAALKLAQCIIQEMGLTIETIKPLPRLAYLSMPPLYRWISAWQA